MQTESAIFRPLIRVSERRLEAASTVGDFDDHLVGVAPAAQRYDRTAVLRTVCQRLADGIFDVGQRSVRNPARNPIEEKVARK